MDKADRARTIDILKEQEQVLLFDAFDAQAAWEIGSTLRNKIIEAGHCAAIEITQGGMLVFESCLLGATRHNRTWVRRKRNTVEEFEQSSYRVTLELEEMGKCLEQRGLSPLEFAASGGGVPVRSVKGALLGTVVVSGMTQEKDHQFAVEAMAKYLGKSVPSVL